MYLLFGRLLALLEEKAVPCDRVRLAATLKILSLCGHRLQVALHLGVPTQQRSLTREIHARSGVEHHLDLVQEVEHPSETGVETPRSFGNQGPLSPAFGEQREDQVRFRKRARTKDEPLPSL